MRGGGPLSRYSPDTPMLQVIHRGIICRKGPDEEPVRICVKRAESGSLAFVLKVRLVVPKIRFRRSPSVAPPQVSTPY